MLRVIPCCQRARKVIRSEAGIEMAVTIVERTLSRKTKMIRIAKTAPRSASWTRLSIDSLM